MSAPRSGVGVTLMHGDNASSIAFSSVGNINDIDGPNKTRKTINTTSLDTTGGYETFIAGFRDGGTVTLNMNFTRAGYATMNTSFELDDLEHYEIRFPDTEKTSLTFEALVTDVGMKVPKDDKISAPVTLKISGKVYIKAWATSITSATPST